MRDDSVYLERIIDYCTEIKKDREIFGNDIETYYENPRYQRSTDMSLLQIGETVNKLSAELRKKHKDIDWDEIVGLRNIVAHRYGWIDRDKTWIILCKYVPELKEYCKAILYDLQKEKK